MSYKLKPEWIEYILHRYAKLKNKQALMITLINQDKCKVDITVQIDATTPPPIEGRVKDKLIKFLNKTNFEENSIKMWDHHYHFRFEKYPILKSPYTKAVKPKR